MTAEIPVRESAKKHVVSLVDDDKRDWALQYKWFLGKGGYVVRREKGVGYIFMHREVLPPPPDMVVDHINHNPQDNRAENLRIVTPAQNTQWRRPTGRGASKYKGVFWDKRNGLWNASVHMDRKHYNLGTFTTQREAAEAYNRMAQELFGEFACLNEIPKDDPDDLPVQRAGREFVGSNPYRGVIKGARGNWRAHIKKDYQDMHLGNFPTPELAARAYDAACIKLRGSRAILNFPESWENPIDIDSPIVVQAVSQVNRYVGAIAHKGGRWRAIIGYGRKTKKLGIFDAEDDAARAYDAAAYARGGKVIYLNFPTEWPNHYVDS